MEITISQNNINDYADKTYPSVTYIIWKNGALKESIIKNFPNLQRLYCRRIQITTLQPLRGCINLRELDCSDNQLTTLEPLVACTNIQKLFCGKNQITTLEPLVAFTNLQELWCSTNQISTLEPLIACTNLRELICYKNQITKLEPLVVCTNLQRLSCWHNQITTLEPLIVCTNLRELYCWKNQITTLEPLIYLRRLNRLECDHNPLEIQTIQIVRLLNRINVNQNSGIYSDNQNIHDVTIQRSVCDSVQSLLKDPKPDFTIDTIIDSDLSKLTIESLIEYCQDSSIHSVHLITYQELLALVWQRIEKSEFKTGLFKILEEQITDSECKCFTGRFNRTLSVLVGFYPDIKINISDQSRISAIILNSKEKIIPYDADQHRILATEKLLAAGYTGVEISPWIDAIDE